MERDESALIESLHFVASAEAWDRFIEVLDNAPEPTAELIALLREQRQRA